MKAKCRQGSLKGANHEIPWTSWRLWTARIHGDLAGMALSEDWGWKPQGEVSPKWQSPGFMVIQPRDWNKEQRWQRGRWACSKHTDPQLFLLTGSPVCANRSPTYIQVQSYQILLKKKNQIKHFVFPLPIILRKQFYKYVLTI